MTDAESTWYNFLQGPPYKHNMIEEGKAEGWLHLPIAALTPWAQLNGVDLKNIQVEDTADKGAGIVATSVITPSTDPSNLTTLLNVPHDIILSKERVEQHVKVDKDFRAVVAALGEFGKTPRISILTFLLTQCLICHPSMHTEPETRFVHTPFTSYIRLLPLVPTLPTFYNSTEQSLLHGTTLSSALQAKFTSLEREFTTLTTHLSSIPWFNDLCLTDLSPLALQPRDWFHLDSFYRSRALDMPHSIGHCMVPVLDMANHTPHPSTTAIYEITPTPPHDALLLLRPDHSLSAGDEISISYGDAKGACEMLFSYGFLNSTCTSAGELFLDLAPLPDDPLGKAKRAVAATAPGFKLVDDHDSGTVAWEGAFVWLIVVNEEDGLEFMLSRTTDGAQELATSWRGEPVSGAEELLNRLRSAEDVWDVLQLRAVSVLQARVGEQIAELDASEEEVRALMAAADQVVGKPMVTVNEKSSKPVAAVNEQHTEGQGVRPEVSRAVGLLRRLEGELLQRAWDMFERRKEELLQSEVVLAYLSGGGNGGDTGEAPNDRQGVEGQRTPYHGEAEEEDFS